MKSNFLGILSTAIAAAETSFMREAQKCATFESAYNVMVLTDDVRGQIASFFFDQGESFADELCSLKGEMYISFPIPKDWYAPHIYYFELLCDNAGIKLETYSINELSQAQETIYRMEI